MILAWQLDPASAAASAALTPWQSPLMLTLMAGLLVTLITTLAGAIVTVITALRVSKVKDMAAGQAGTMLTVERNTEAIKGHVNGERTITDNKIATLQTENALLREMLSDQKVTALLLAQAAALHHKPGAALVPEPPAGG